VDEEDWWVNATDTFDICRISPWEVFSVCSSIMGIIVDKPCSSMCALKKRCENNIKRRRKRNSAESLKKNRNSTDMDLFHK
jgi:hypothetical protein